jgi:uncharacterized membrane protein YpjA
MLLLSHAGNGAVESMLVMVRCRCRVMLTMVLSSLSHAGDSIVEVTLVMALPMTMLT